MKFTIETEVDELPVYASHDIPVYRKGFKPWDNGFKDWSDVPTYYYGCINCHRQLTRISAAEKKCIQIGWRPVMIEDAVRLLFMSRF